MGKNCKEHSKKGKDNQVINLINNKSNNRFGKYGLLSYSIIFNKLQEFRLWMKNEKCISDESEELKYYAEFINLYNQAIFPHHKYYDLAKYQAKKNEK